MADFNFFEPYLEPIDSPSSSKLVWYFLFFIVIVALIITQFVMLSEKNQVEDAIAAIDAETSSEAVTQALNRVIEKEQVNDFVRSAVLELVIFDQVVTSTNTVDVVLFDKINSEVPEAVYINSMSISDNQLVISGYSDAYESIALFQHQLRSLDALTEVFAPTMAEVQGNYSFTITAALNMEVSLEN